MKIRPVTNNEDWFAYMLRAAKANRKNPDIALPATVKLLLQTPYSHMWINTISSKGRKRKGNRLLKIATQYFYSLSIPQRIQLVDEYFNVNWEAFKL
jgi:hypothetical protein